MDGVFYIYAIESNASDVVYVGQTCQPGPRSKQHWSNLRSGMACNPILLQEYRTHGREALTFRILETCAKAEVKFREQFWINKFAKTKFVANLRPAGGVSLVYGKKWSSARRKQRSIDRTGAKGRVLSKEESARINSLRKPCTPARRAQARISAYKHLARLTRRAVINLDTGAVYYSGSECARKLGVCQQSVSDACLGKLNTVKGFHLAYQDSVKH